MSVEKSKGAVKDSVCFADMSATKLGLLQQNNCYTVLPALGGPQPSKLQVVHLQKKPASLDVRYSGTDIGNPLLLDNGSSSRSVDKPALLDKQDGHISENHQRIHKVLAAKRKPPTYKQQTLSLTTKQMLLDVYGCSYSDIRTSSYLTRKPSYDRYLSRRHALNINKRREAPEEILPKTLDTLSKERGGESKKLADLLRHKSLLESRNHNRCIEKVRAAQTSNSAFCYFEELTVLGGTE